MELLGVYLACFGFSDNARSVAQFASRKQNRAIWTVSLRCLCFAPFVATTAGDDTTGSQRPAVSYPERSRYQRHPLHA
jgi:hypothetical protein